MTIQSPTLFRCRLIHIRHHPFTYRFTHTLYMWLVDVDTLAAPVRPLVRFHAADHLGDPTRSIRENVETFLSCNGIDLAGGRILMLAQPRSAGYAFDPVSFFFCYRADDSLAIVIAEVRNTFGERHCYLLTPDAAGKADFRKEFYVSPYFPVDGRYRTRFVLNPDSVRIVFALHRALRNRSAPVTALTATLVGKKVRIPAVIVSPRLLLTSYRTIALIHWHARRLRRRGLTSARRLPHQPQLGVTPIRSSHRE
ncbi:DUF1365 domain-containing protein [Nocardia sp. NBC_00403]|uniref:DUF1365 domain-containing protein n=1 Tax=Nocardia sp. NBC_00403 TaxID=2975990 RepID=UPI002E216087